METSNEAEQAGQPRTNKYIFTHMHKSTWLFLLLTLPVGIFLPVYSLSAFLVGPVDLECEGEVGKRGKSGGQARMHVAPASPVASNEGKERGHSYSAGATHRPLSMLHLPWWCFPGVLPQERSVEAGCCFAKAPPLMPYSRPAAVPASLVVANPAVVVFWVAGRGVDQVEVLLLVVGWTIVVVEHGGRQQAEV